MFKFTKFLVSLIFILSAHNLMAETKEAKEALAVKAATEWLKLVDAKNYRQSWEETSTIFKAKVNAKDWAKTASEVRSPLGAFNSRKMKVKNYMTSLPGVPDGEYVVIQFETQFQNRKNMIETVTPMFDDLKWRVSGYYLK